LSDSITTGLTTCGGPGGTKIVNGVDATANSWPWIVNLGFQTQDMVDSGSFSTFACGGTILNSHFVLTAAHCCKDMAHVHMAFAQHAISSSDSNEFTLQSGTFINHPSYAPPATNFDVCIIDVGQSIWDAATAAGADSSKVAAACLPSAAATHGDACWVAGWGTTSSGGSQPNILQSVGVNIMSDDYCNANTSPGFALSGSDELCAGLPDCNGNNLTDEGKDSCQGDSGGPLICNVGGQATITGIVSWGIGCADEGFPGVYGEVFDYLSWINSNSVVSG